MEKVRPWCGQPSDRLLKNRTEQMRVHISATCEYDFGDTSSRYHYGTTPYKRWSKCTMKKIGGRFLQERRG